jgi:hypothetical protein
LEDKRSFEQFGSRQGLSMPSIYARSVYIKLHGKTLTTGIIDGIDATAYNKNREQTYGQESIPLNFPLPMGPIGVLVDSM